MPGSAYALSLPCVVKLPLGEVKDKGKGKSKGREVQFLGFLKAYPALAMAAACHRLRATFGKYAVVRRKYLRLGDRLRGWAKQRAAQQDPGWNFHAVEHWRKSFYTGESYEDSEMKEEDDRRNNCI